MGSNDGSVFVGADVASAAGRCVRALESAKFKKIIMSEDGYSIRAEKQVSTQWTKTPIYITLMPVQGGTLVQASASASAQSAVSLGRSPSAVVIRKFLDEMARQ